jgi:hypothetical protein
MEDTWIFWTAVFSSSMAAGVLGAYFAFRFQASSTRNLKLLLQREVALSRVREECTERKLEEVVQAVEALHQASKERLQGLSHQIDELIISMESRPRNFKSELGKRWIDLA